MLACKLLCELQTHLSLFSSNVHIDQSLRLVSERCNLSCASQLNLFCLIYFHRLRPLENCPFRDMCDEIQTMLLLQVGIN